MGYLLALPEGYDDDPQRRWPVVLFLHGRGERGDDVTRVATHGPPLLVAEGREFPAIVISPQCPPTKWWPHTMVALSGLLDHVEASYRVDADRVYLTGLSMGGYGTLLWAASQPERFAAVVAVCGGAGRYEAEALSPLPTWLFHGTADPVVAVSESLDVYKAMTEADANDVRLTLYDGLGHESWTPAFDEQRLWDWLFAQKRGGRRR